MFCLGNQKESSVMLTTSSTKATRNRVDISSKELSRNWCKRLKKSKPEIEAAIAKVGDNAETVMKELGAKREVAPTVA
jgi:membrane protein DedA with SNARE-associated domain